MNTPPFPVENPDNWQKRDGDAFPMTGRQKEVELGNDTVTAEFKAGWLQNGQPRKVTIETENGWRHHIDRETWRVGA